MPTNPIFQLYSSTDDQNLIDSLVSECITIYGQDCLYIPRVYTNFDQLYGTDVQSVYQDTFEIEMYLVNVSGFQGDKSFMSKFGLEIRDQITLAVSISTFRRLLTESIGYDRPREGDLIYWPLNKKCFQIKFVDPFVMYYPLGALYTMQMTCELFEYSNEVFNTGIPEIDILQKKFSTNALDYALLDENGLQLVTENNEIITLEQYKMQAIDPITDSETLTALGLPLISFSEKNPYGDID